MPRRPPPDSVSVVLRKLEMTNGASLTITVEVPMIPTERVPTHPGEILQEEFLAPLGLTQVKLAEHIGVPVQRINEIIRGKRGITPETAWLFAQAFGTTPQFWVNLQSNYDLASARPSRNVAKLRRAG